MILVNSISVARGAKPVIKDFSGEFKAGTITAIIGPNGCGKSTLLAAIAGDLTLTSGAIKLNEKDFIHMVHDDKIEAIQYVSLVKSALEQNGAIVLVTREVLES